MSKTGKRNYVAWWMAVLSVAFFGVGTAFASSTTDLGSVSTNILNTFGSLAKLITAIAYVAGIGFAVGSVLKFKAHKDNPTQIPVGTPIALLFVAVALLFLPTVLQVAGTTIFGSSASVGGTAGTSTIPGFQGGGAQ